MDKRKEDADESLSRFRADSRIFRLNDEWYFSTREGDRGPFKTEAIAEKELRRFINEISELQHDYIEIDNTEKRKVDTSVWDRYDQMN